MPVYEKWKTIKYGAFTVGKDASGYDVKFFGATTANYLLWDASANSLLLYGTFAPATTDKAALGTTALMFSDLFLASGAVINFNNGDVTLTHSANLLTIAGGGLTMGASGTPAGDFTLWGTTALYRVWFDVDGDTNGAWYFGDDDEGVDVGFYGQTAGDSMLWDASGGALVFAGLSKIDIGVSGTPLVLTAGTPILEMFSTCASTSGSTSAEPVLFNTVMTGAGGVGGRFRVNMETNVALGGWANAFKATVDCKTSGKATGLLSVACAELTQAASNTGAGTNAVYEAEVVCPASWADTKYTSIMYVGTSGATVTNFDTTGLFLEINGVAVGSGKFFQANTAAAATHALRCRIGGVLYYIMLTNVGA